MACHFQGPVDREEECVEEGPQGVVVERFDWRTLPLTVTPGAADVQPSSRRE